MTSMCSEQHFGNCISSYYHQKASLFKNVPFLYILRWKYPVSKKLCPLENPRWWTMSKMTDCNIPSEYLDLIHMWVAYFKLAHLHSSQKVYAENHIFIRTLLALEIPVCLQLILETRSIPQKDHLMLSGLLDGWITTKNPCSMTYTPRAT